MQNTTATGSPAGTALIMMTGGTFGTNNAGTFSLFNVRNNIGTTLANTSFGNNVIYGNWDGGHQPRRHGRHRQFDGPGTLDDRRSARLGRCFHWHGWLGFIVQRGNVDRRKRHLYAAPRRQHELRKRRKHPTRSDQ